MTKEKELTGMDAVAHNLALPLVTIQQARKIIEFCYEEGETPNRYFVTPLLIGDAGVGKTVIMKALARDMGVPYLIIKLANLEKEDLTGFIHLNKDGKTYKFVPHQDLPKYLEDPNTLLIFDEINRGQGPTIKAFFNVIDERKIGDFELPPTCKVIAAMNPPDKNYQVADILGDRALKKRFRPICVKHDGSAYLRYIKEGTEEKGHPFVIGYLEAYPDKVYDHQALSAGQVFPSPHAWSRVSQTCFAFDKNHPDWPENPDKYMFTNLIAGDVNINYAEEFVNYIRDMSVVIGPKDIFYKWKKTKPRLKSLVNGHRHDILTDSMQGIAVFLAEEKPKVKEIAEIYAELLDILPEDIAGTLLENMGTECDKTNEGSFYYTDLNAELATGFQGGPYPAYDSFFKKMHSLDDKIEGYAGS